MTDLSSKCANKTAIRDKDLNLLEYRIFVDGDHPPHRALPSKISIVPLPSLKRTSREYQLFLDEVPIPSSMFKYDPDDRELCWTNVYGGGCISFFRDGAVGSGTLGSTFDLLSIKIGATAEYMCDTANAVGASYKYEGENQIGISWDPTSSKWKSATWQKETLRMNYTIIDQGPILPPNYYFEFEDMDFEWEEKYDVGSGTSQGSVTMGDRGDDFGWVVVFKNNVPLDPEFLIPTQLQAFEDLFGTNIDGAFCIDEDHKGELYGLKGVRNSRHMAGYFRTSEKVAPFGIFSGKLKVDGKQPTNVKSFVKGNELHWKGLSFDLQQKLGLPEHGVLKFEPDGSLGRCATENLTAHRLGVAETLQAIQSNSSLYRTITQSLSTDTFKSLAGASSGLDINGLLVMSPFSKNEGGEWYDAVQEEAVADLWTIVNSHIPEFLWKKLFGGTTQPTLSGYLDKIANTKVQDEEGNILDPDEYYRTLSTMVLCITLQESENENAKLINALRAEKQFQENTSRSPVYQRHMQMLFEHHWKEKESLTDSYLSDQRTNATNYEPIIDNETERQISAIHDYVHDDEDGTLKQDLENYVRTAAEHAKSMKLYWAFSYYTYCTHPNILAKFMLALSVDLGNGDGTELMRLVQRGITVLTALDSSGYFAEMYVETLNSFFGTTILLSLIDYAEDGMDSYVVTEYLEKFVEECLSSGHEELVQAARDIQALLDSENAAEDIDEAIRMLRRIGAGETGIYGNQKVITKFYKEFKSKFPKFPASVAKSITKGLIMITGGFQIFMIVMGFNNFDDLDDWQKAQLLTGTIQFATQSIYNGIRSGLSMAEHFSAGAYPKPAKLAALSKGGEGSVKKVIQMVGSALKNLSDNIARYLAKFAAKAAKAILRVSKDMLEQTAKSLGKNLDRFVGPSLGALFEIAGIVFDIRGIVNGDKGFMLAADITGIMSSAFTLFAVVGGWFATGSATFGAILSIAGALGTVFALVSLGLMIASIFSKPPDPIEEFVNDYVKPAGLSVDSEKNSVEYLATYTSESKGYELVGTTFTPNNSSKQLCAKIDTSIVLGNNDHTSNYVMLISTDGMGQSVISTAVGNETDGYSELVHLVVTDSGQICFKKKEVPQNETRSETDYSFIWKCTTVKNPVLEGGNVSQLFVSIEFVGAKSAKKYLQVQGGNVVLGESKAQWSMSMAGLKPQDMVVTESKYVANVDLGSSQTFGPAFTFPPSLDVEYSVEPALPSFLSFDNTSGIASPNGNSASAGTTSHTMTAKNKLGEDSADFKVEVVDVLGS